MKKSLVLAMAMALGVTASAYAANPFSDVPAGHWAYDSISKLAAAGVIEGYGDDTFRGDRLMTRYEMAQIVAKAMAKGANVEKLAAEFADELDALGVRVAALEKKADNVKITGQIRYRWATAKLKAANGASTKGRTHDLRSRLWFNGQINKGWKYIGMVENIQNFINDVGDENTAFQRAYVEGRLGGAKVTAGRWHAKLVGGDSDVYENRVDAVKLAYGDKFKVAGWYGKPTAMNSGAMDGFDAYEKFAGARLSYDAKSFGIYAEYDKFSAGNNIETARNRTQDIFGIGIDGKFKDFGLKALYLHGKHKDVDTGKKNGFTIEATYKGAKPAKVGSWGLGVKYYDQGNHTYVDSNGVKHGIVAIQGATMPAVRPEGFKGFRVSANYTFAKNMVGTINYIDLKGKGNNASKAKTFYTQMIFTF
jgi:hypothetical protein